MAKYGDKHRIKCGNCGVETNKPALVRVNGIAKWWCNICADRRSRKNGG